MFDTSAQTFTPQTKILIVDDSPDTCLLNERILKRLGYQFITKAHDGDVALKIIQEPSNGVELVLSDDKMENLDGIDLYLMLRHAESTKMLPFLLITGKPEGIPESIDQDCYAGFLAKPYPIQKLVDSLAKLFQSTINAK